MNTVEAPWDALQVAALVRWQSSSMVHPLTCPNRNDGKHRTAEYGRGDLGTLWVYENKLWCPDCHYEQIWVPAICVQSGPLIDPFNYHNDLRCDTTGSTVNDMSNPKEHNDGS